MILKIRKLDPKIRSPTLRLRPGQPSRKSARRVMNIRLRRMAVDSERVLE
jgi:hypothetical protein